MRMPKYYKHKRKYTKRRKKTRIKTRIKKKRKTKKKGGGLVKPLAIAGGIITLGGLGKLIYNLHKKRDGKFRTKRNNPEGYAYLKEKEKESKRTEAVHWGDDPAWALADQRAANEGAGHGALTNAELAARREAAKNKNKAEPRRNAHIYEDDVSTGSIYEGGGGKFEK